MTWDDVEAAVAEHSRLYNAMLTARQENHGGSKKVTEAEEAWLIAHEARYQALLEHWTEEDGHTPDGTKRVGTVLQRYYAEMQSVWKERKEAEKARKKEESSG